LSFNWSRLKHSGQPFSVLRELEVWPVGKAPPDASRGTHSLTCLRISAVAA
jgi:hypothetical protein